MPTLQTDQVKTGVAPDDLVRLEDLGSGAVGFPVLDGRNLINVRSQGERIVGQHQFGSLTSYGTNANSIASQIQYTQVFLAAGITLNTMRVYRTTGGSPARHIRLGVYNQAVPSDEGGLPLNKIAETAETTTSGTFSYIQPALLAPLAITTTGFYWVAFVADTATPLRFQVTNGSYPPGFTPLWRESTTGTLLPATTGTLSNPASAIVFAAAVE
jgi:hypothetical protein